MGAMTNDSTEAYIGWEKVVACTGKGRREVHYFLKRRGGARDLVIVGIETNDMTYDYIFNDGNFLFPILNPFCGLKLTTEKELMHWLDSIISDGQPNESSRHLSRERYRKVKKDTTVGTRVPMLNHNVPGFAWLGSSWVRRKQRSHYQSFCRNGAVISIRDFVYVLAEDNKRLVAYLEDMYEDVEGNKMVLVRWFHKIDEVGIVLPSCYNDKEIFFSLCLQDICVECIDGVATVLSPEHYEKLSDEATRIGLIPFMCSRQFDNGYLKPFEVTVLEGYWNQKFLRNKGSFLEISSNLKHNTSFGDAIGSRPKKRIRLSYSSGACFNRPHKKGTITSCSLASQGALPGQKGGFVTNCTEHGNSSAIMTGIDNAEIQDFPQLLTLGTCVEVLSQDSGIRGCWFRALVIEKHKDRFNNDRIKVQYKDVMDADDESKNLQEWIVPSRIAAQDLLGIRLFGRSIVRPTLSSDGGKVCDSLNIGSIVDAWWHDGWWEGIVVKKESHRITVYFPGERKEFVFSPKDLRHSKEWFENCWKYMNPRPDIASKCGSLDRTSDTKQDRFCSSVTLAPDRYEVVKDLSKDDLLLQVRWISSGKKRNRRSPIHKVDFGTKISSPETRSLVFKKSFGSSPLKFDLDNCKNGRVSSELISPFSNLVVSM